MAHIYLPAHLAKFTRGLRNVEACGATLGEVIDTLEIAFPGIRERLVANDRLTPGLAAAVDNVLASGLREAVRDSSEVVFLPALKGGV